MTIVWLILTVCERSFLILIIVQLFGYDVDLLIFKYGLVAYVGGGLLLLKLVHFNHCFVKLANFITIDNLVPRVQIQCTVVNP